jgi:gluconokinase
MWFLGIDLGTGSCKTVIVDEQARVLGFGAGEYASSSLQEKWQEQDPGAVLQGMLHSVQAARESAGALTGKCAGVSIGGALHSLLAVDRSGNPLTGVITWADGRGAEQAQPVRGMPIASELYRRTGCPPHGMYPLYKIRWLQQERPDIFKQAARFLSAKEYVLQRLTGEYIVDYCLAAGSGLLNTNTLDWDPVALDLANITPDQVSTLHDPREIFHCSHADLAMQMGISPGTPLVIGSADAANSNLGAGAVLPWQATCMIGTSGALRVIAPQPILDSEMRTWCYAIDKAHWLVGGAINNGGIALSWWRDILNQALPASPSRVKLSFDDLLAFAGQVGAGAGGLVCLPFLAGERSPHWNLNARAVFFGLTLQHDLRHLCRALLEGIALRICSVHAALTEMGVEIRQIHASGGFTNSTLWLQLTANALNRELIVPDWGETSSLGAAMWAILATGESISLEKTQGLVHLGKFYSPTPSDAQIYAQLYPIYTALYESVIPVFERIASFQKQLR